MVGSAGATIHPALSPLLMTLLHGAPRVHMFNLRLVGRLKVEGAELTLMDCSIEDPTGQSAGGGRRHLAGTPVERGLSITHSVVVLVRIVLFGHTSGAIEVHGASLAMIDCTVSGSRAPSGGALMIGSNAMVLLELCKLNGNRADLSGGAINIEEGSNLTVAESIFMDNSAAVSGGALQVIALSRAAFVFTLCLSYQLSVYPPLSLRSNALSPPPFLPGGRWQGAPPQQDPPPKQHGREQRRRFDRRLASRRA
eukprot:5939434-Prymnesium_polylepis.1